MEWIQLVFEKALELINIVLHIDQYLLVWMSFLGPWIYLILFLIIFCETGLVITPFLPGDSLLFALGAIGAMQHSELSTPLLFVILSVAAFLGDTVNYSIGKRYGPKIFLQKKIPFINKDYLIKTQNFYLKHGGKTILWARFIPIIRTFAPFVAGIAEMPYKRFINFNVFGGIFWVGSFLLLGHLFGNLPIVQKNFHLVIFAIIGISFLPVLIEFIKSKWAK